MLGSPIIQLTQFNHNGWTYSVSCNMNARSSYLAQENHHLLPVPAPPRHLNLPFCGKAAVRLRSRSRCRVSRNSGHDDPDYHWSAATPDTSIASHARSATPPQSKTCGGFNNRAYAPCANQKNCQNTHVKLQSNMFWCSACWNSMSLKQQKQCHREANNPG